MEALLEGLERKGLRLLNKQLAPAVQADVALDEFARIRRLEVSAALAALVALRRVLIVGGRLADLHLRHRRRDHHNGCGRADSKRRAGEHDAA
jgi:hypothetical protein